MIFYSYRATIRYIFHHFLESYAKQVIQVPLLTCTLNAMEEIKIYFDQY